MEGQGANKYESLHSSRHPNPREIWAQRIKWGKGTLLHSSGVSVLRAHWSTSWPLEDSVSGLCGLTYSPRMEARGRRLVPFPSLHKPSSQGHFCEKGPAFTLLKDTEKGQHLQFGTSHSTNLDQQDVLDLINIDNNYSKQFYFFYLLLRFKNGSIIDFILSSFIVSLDPHNNPMRLLLFSCSDVSESLWSHGLQYARLPCPSLFPGVCSNSRPVLLLSPFYKSENWSQEWWNARCHTEPRLRPRQAGCSAHGNITALVCVMAPMLSNWLTCLSAILHMVIDPSIRGSGFLFHTVALWLTVWLQWIHCGQNDS